MDSRLCPQPPQVPFCRPSLPGTPQGAWCTHTTSTSLRNLKIIPGNLNEIVRLWILLLEILKESLSINSQCSHRSLLRAFYARLERCRELRQSEAESKEKYGVWDPMTELTLNSPNVHSRVDSNTFTMDNPMPESTLKLCQSRLYPQFGTLDFVSVFRVLLSPPSAWRVTAWRSKPTSYLCSLLISTQLIHSGSLKNDIFCTSINCTYNTVCPLWCKLCNYKYTQSDQLCLRFLLLQNHATSYNFCKGERRKTW